MKFIDLKEEFRSWLIEHKGVSRKVAGDILCRCRRLDEEVLNSLDLSVSSVDNYLLAMNEIKNYAIAHRLDNQTKYALSSCLRGAMKKYCEFKNPNEISRYPNAYNL